MGENRIIYGAPGVGKSHSISNLVGNHYRIVTTFHPEYSYFDFVGGYKPIKKEEEVDYLFHYYNKTKALIEKEAYTLPRNTLTYDFLPGPFLEAYVLAWKEYLKQGKEVYLIIEEINRGNCPAIFGEVFQLLDRDFTGASEYYVNVNDNIARYLENKLDVMYEAELKAIFDAKGIEKPENMFSVLLLPNNLSIIATMNTSDQSLFPLDSAFKRRWNWEYIPIDYKKASGRIIEVHGNEYGWGEFLEVINETIYKLTQSEDKCIGPYFVRADKISENEFKGKVLFYIWQECLKDETEDILVNYLPKSKKLINGIAVDETITFKDFYDPDYGTLYVEEFLTMLGVVAIQEEI